MASAVGGGISNYSVRFSENYHYNGVNSYLVIPNNAVNFGTGDFTFECWVYSFRQANNSDKFYVLLNGEYWGSSSMCGIGVSNALGLYFSYAGSAMYTQNYLSSNVWQHIAVVRTGTTIKIFVDGVSQTLYIYGSFNGGADYTNTTNTRFIGKVGASDDNDGVTGNFFGHISNLRIVKGTALYTSNFTPSTTPLTAVSGTSLLTCQSETIVDNSGLSGVITYTGVSVRPIMDYLFSIGEAIYTIPGTYNWVAPTGVTSVCVLCVGGGGAGGWISGGGNGSGGGGGGLGWKNNIQVVPGNSYTIVVGNGGSLNGNGGSSSFSSFITATGGKSANNGRSGGSYIGGDGGGTGGYGGYSWSNGGAGGGGAAGYTGNGGNGADVASQPTAGGNGSGGGAAGAYSDPGTSRAFSGGGVGLYGQGNNGIGDISGGGTKGGSGGGNGIYHGGMYGGGGGGSNHATFSCNLPWSGAVRIIWGTNRSFPSNAA